LLPSRIPRIARSFAAVNQVEAIVDDGERRVGFLDAETLKAR
jgi:hypothetical protein